MIMYLYQEDISCYLQLLELIYKVRSLSGNLQLLLVLTLEPIIKCCVEKMMIGCLLINYISRNGP